jgi:hypothetical protein
MKKPYQWLAWIGTAGLLVSSILAALNIYPYYVFGFIISNVLWTLIGILWQEKSLIILNAGLTIIYVIGLLL